MDEENAEERALIREHLESMSDRQLIVHVALEQHGMKKQVAGIHQRVRSLENLRTYFKGAAATVSAALAAAAIYVKIKK